MKHACHICGEEHDLYDMVPIQVSRVRWLCWRCYKNGQYQVGHSQATNAWNEARTQWRRKERQ